MNNLICLTGAIGSGKSTVANILEQDGFIQVDISMILATCYRDKHYSCAVERFAPTDMETIQRLKRDPATGVRQGIIAVGNFLDDYLPSLVAYIISTHPGRDIVIPSVKNTKQYEAIKKLLPNFKHSLIRVIRPDSTGEQISFKDSRTEITETNAVILNNGSLADLKEMTRDIVIGCALCS